jgi:hypothetical protein
MKTGCLDSTITVIPKPTLLLLFTYIHHVLAKHSLTIEFISYLMHV